MLQGQEEEGLKARLLKRPSSPVPRRCYCITMVPALADWRICQTVAYTAALPTVRWLCETKVALRNKGGFAKQRRLCKTKAALPDLGTKDPAHSQGGFANGRRQLCQGDHRGATPSFKRCRGLRGFGSLGLRRWQRRHGLPISWTCGAAASTGILTAPLVPCYTCLNFFQMFLLASLPSISWLVWCIYSLCFVSNSSAITRHGGGGGVFGESQLIYKNLTGSPDLDP